MTRTLTLTAAEWEVLQRDGTAWIVRGGEPSPQCVRNWPDAASGEYNPACCRFPKSCSADVLFAPAELVAAAALCGTCGGSHERHYEWGGRAGTADPCPDCRITLAGECPECGGVALNICDCYCPRCAPNGTVTLGDAYPASEVLPITHWGAQDRPDGPQLTFDVSMDGTPVIDYWDGKRTTEVTDALAHHGDLHALVGRYTLKVRLA